MTLTEAYERRLEAFYNKNHDPRDGRFTSSPGGKMWSGVSAHPDHRVSPTFAAVTRARLEQSPEHIAKQIYNTDLGDRYHSSVESASYDGGATYIEGYIYRRSVTGTNSIVGNFKRNISVDDNGKLLVYHDELFLDPAHHGKGIADRFNMHAVEKYQKYGVDRIELSAEHDVGGFAWARQGFRHNGPDDERRRFLGRQLERVEGQLLKPQFRDHAGRVRKEVRALQAALKAGEDVQPIHIASIGEGYARGKGVGEGGIEYPTWPGKSVLLGTKWPGVYYFDANRAVTAAASSLEHANLRPAFREHVHVSGGIEFACHDPSCRPPGSGGTGGSLSGGKGKTMVEIGEVNIHGVAVQRDDPYYKGELDAGLVKHLGSLRVAKEMTDRERAGLESDLDYEVKDFSIGSREPFAEAVAIANSNVATVPRTTVGISVQLGAIWDRYADTRDDIKKMDKVTEALTRYEGEYQTDLRGARAKLSRELERISGVSVASGFVSYVHQQWANSAHSHESVAMQLVAAKDRKLTEASASLKKHLTGPGRPRSLSDLAVAEALVKKAPEALGAVFSATYRLTQRELAKAGITEVEVYRGIKVTGALAKKIIAQPSPLSSWTTDEFTAFEFSIHGGMYKATVPVSQVYSLANLSGTGALNEREVLVLGNRITASEHKIPGVKSEDLAAEEIPVVEIDAEDFDWIKTVHAHTHISGGIEFACRDASCRPPTSGGTGGSKPGYGPRSLPDVRLAGIRVTYKPKYPDDHPNPGEVVWARVPFEEDPTQSKDRPVLVIGRVNGSTRLAAIQLTSAGRGRSNELDIGTGSYDRQGRNSAVRLHRIIQIDPTNYRREGSVLDREKFDTVIGKLAEFHRTPITIAASAADDDNQYSRTKIHHTSIGRWPHKSEADHQFACHDPACAPPPVGVGGSKPGGAVDHSKANKEVVEDVKGSARAGGSKESYIGRPGRSEGEWDEIRANPEDRAAMAAAYREMPSDDPAAHGAYRSLAREIGEQFKHLEASGIKAEFVDYDPYPTAAAMVRDVQRGVIKVMNTSVTGSHPFFTDHENNMFRAVHDVYGHAATGRGFDRHGERAAYISHSEMFRSRDAIRALATETEALNAIVHETGHFPEQKIALMPDALVFEDIAPAKSFVAAAWLTPALIEFACHDPSCRPPTAGGTGGSLAGWQAHRGRITSLDRETLDRVISQGMEGAFGTAPTTVTPWPRAPRRKGEKLYDEGLVREALRNPPKLEKVDPRTLYATQPGLVKSHAEYYLSGEYKRTGKPSADQENVGNQFPLVYVNSRGQHLLLAGHHRALADMIQGNELDAIVVRERT